MGYAIPNNCAVMYLGNIEEAAQTSDTYLAKLLLTVSKNTILKKKQKKLILQGKRNGLILFGKSIQSG